MITVVISFKNQGKQKHPYRCLSLLFWLTYSIVILLLRPLRGTICNSKKKTNIASLFASLNKVVIGIVIIIAVVTLLLQTFDQITILVFVGHQNPYLNIHSIQYSRKINKNRTGNNQ